MRVWRIILASVGIVLGLFGVARLFTQIPSYSLKWLAIWLIAAVVIHDGILSPLVVSVGWLIRRHLPDRARRYLQAGLIMAGMVTVIAVPMIWRRDSQPESKAILNQDFAGNLSLLIGIIAGLTLLAYAVRVARDRSPVGPPTEVDRRPDP
jgi:uncharacterized membrane protein YfcA